MLAGEPLCLSSAFGGRVGERAASRRDSNHSHLKSQGYARVPALGMLVFNLANLRIFNANTKIPDHLYYSLLPAPSLFRPDSAAGPHESPQSRLGTARKAGRGPTGPST